MKADYLRYIEDAQLNQNLMRNIIEGLGRDDRPEAHLILICPFLHYAEIDAQYELSVCGVYLDRMVLGGHRLHKICESPNHRSCEYFAHPRVCS